MRSITLATTASTIVGSAGRGTSKDCTASLTAGPTASGGGSVATALGADSGDEMGLGHTEAGWASCAGPVPVTAGVEPGGDVPVGQPPAGSVRLPTSNGLCSADWPHTLVAGPVAAGAPGWSSSVTYWLQGDAFVASMTGLLPGGTSLTSPPGGSQVLCSGAVSLVPAREPPFSLAAKGTSSTPSPGTGYSARRDVAGGSKVKAACSEVSLAFVVVFSAAFSTRISECSGTRCGVVSSGAAAGGAGCFDIQGNRLLPHGISSRVASGKAGWPWPGATLESAGGVAP